MKKTLRNTCCWLAFILLLLALSIACHFLDTSLFNSPYMSFYELNILSLIIGFIGWKLLKSEKEFSVTKLLDYIGFHGNSAMVILFFPPIYHIWRTLTFGPE